MLRLDLSQFLEKFFAFSTSRDMELSNVNIPGQETGGRVVILGFGLSPGETATLTLLRGLHDVAAIPALIATSSTVDDRAARLQEAFIARVDGIIATGSCPSDIKYCSTGNWTGHAVTAARWAVANQLGGIGFFSGHWFEIDLQTNRAVKRPSAKLLSGTPCRAGFARGFLWDEGFHLMVTSKFDEDLALYIIKHWLERVQPSGWIPR